MHGLALSTVRLCAANGYNPATAHRAGHKWVNTDLLAQGWQYRAAKAEAWLAARTEEAVITAKKRNHLAVAALRLSVWCKTF